MRRLLSILVAVSIICGPAAGIMAEELVEDVVKPIPIPIFQYPRPLPYGSISITEGWTLIAMPVLPNKPYTVKQFIKDVESPFRWEISYIKADQEEGAILEDKETIDTFPQSHWKVLTVMVYKNGRFNRYPKQGVSYNMVPGEAYFVRAKYSGPWCNLPGWRPKTKINIMGKPPKVPISLNLNRGWNGVSVSPTVYCNGTPSTSVWKISRELVAQNIKATQLLLWNEDKQRWERYRLPVKIPVTLDGAEAEEAELEDNEELRRLRRTIRPDQGFFLRCKENGLYIPGLPRQPFPPFVEKVGLVETAEEPLVPGQKFTLSIKQYYLTNLPAIWHLPLVAVNENVAESLALAAGDNAADILQGILKIYVMQNGSTSSSVTYLEVHSVIQRRGILHEAESESQ